VTNNFSPVRRHERYSVVLSVICRSGERSLADQVVNLSYGGACVKTRTPLPPGTKHNFAITVPDAKLRASVVDVEAVVAWSQDDSMGLRFAKQCDGIETYLKRLERSAHSI
jgi:hypothetical protein